MALLKRRALRTAGAVLAAVGCAPDRTPLAFTEQSPTVHMVLVAGQDSARAIVARVHPSDGRYELVVGASVTLSHASGSYDLPAAQPELCTGTAAESEAPEPGGCYAGRLPHPPVPGEEWSLDVRFPGGGPRLTGRTRIPARPVLEAGLETALPVAPQTNEFAVQAETGTRWRFDAAAGGAQLLPGEATGFANGAALAAPCEFEVVREPDPVPVAPPTASLRLQLSGVRCTGAGVSWDSIQARLRLLAFDTAYVRYDAQVRRAGAVRRPLARAGLDSGFGLFGSVASGEAVLRLIPSP